MTTINTSLRPLAGLSAAVALATASAAQAQPQADTFTFTSEATSEVSIGSEGTGPNPYSAAYFTGNFTTALANGSSAKGTYICIAMTQPPAGKLFDMHMLCDGTDNRGTYSLTMGCTVINAKNSNWSCIGGMYGKSGGYAGKRGSLTNYTVNGKATGTGQWYR